MITAYHMIGLGTLDLGRLGSKDADEQMISQVVERARQRYQAIVASGVLQPAREHDEKLPREKGHFFFEDRQANDHQYVFLSVGRRYWYEPEQVNFGFLFDAIKLIEQGAILRKYDLLSDYEDMLSELVVARTGFREPTEWSPEEQAALFAALDDPDEHPGYVGPNDAYYNLLDAVRDLKFDVPGVREVLDEFRQKVREMQGKTQLAGQEAIAYIEEQGEGGRCELLVPGQLPITQAIGTVEYGRIIKYEQ
jgi:hypothetical protein